MDEFGARFSARRWWAVGWVGVLAASALYWFTFRAGCVDAVAVTQTGARYTVDIRFNGEVSYRGHFPLERGQVLQIHIEPEWFYRFGEDRYFELGDLDLRIRGGSPVALLAYEGHVPGGPLISVRFTQAMRFQVQPGQDARAMRLVLEPVASFADVQK